MAARRSKDKMVKQCLWKAWKLVYTVLTYGVNILHCIGSKSACQQDLPTTVAPTLHLQLAEKNFCNLPLELVLVSPASRFFFLFFLVKGEEKKKTSGDFRQVFVGLSQNVGTANQITSVS